MITELRFVNSTKVIAAIAVVAGIVVFSGCGPSPTKEPVLHVEGDPGTKFSYVVTYINHEETTEKSEKAKDDVTIPDSKVYIEKLKQGHDGIKVALTMQDTGSITLRMFDGKQAIENPEASARREMLQVNDEVKIQAGQVYRPQPWSTFLGMTVIWGMAAVCLLGLVVVGIALVRDLNRYLEKQARRQAHDSTS